MLGALVSEAGGYWERFIERMGGSNCLLSYSTLSRHGVRSGFRAVGSEQK